MLLTNTILILLNIKAENMNSRFRIKDIALSQLLSKLHRLMWILVVKEEVDYLLDLHLVLVGILVTTIIQLDKTDLQSLQIRRQKISDLQIHLAVDRAKTLLFSVMLSTLGETIIILLWLQSFLVMQALLGVLSMLQKAQLQLWQLLLFQSLCYNQVWALLKVEPSLYQRSQVPPKRTLISSKKGPLLSLKKTFNDN